MERGAFTCLGVAVCLFLVVVVLVLLVIYFFGWLTLLWWIVYIILFLRVAPDDRISLRKTFAILFGAPVIAGIVWLGAAGLKGGVSGGLPVLLPVGFWIADKLTEDWHYGHGVG